MVLLLITTLDILHSQARLTSEDGSREKIVDVYLCILIPSLNQESHKNIPSSITLKSFGLTSASLQRKRKPTRRHQRTRQRPTSNHSRRCARLTRRARRKTSSSRLREAAVTRLRERDRSAAREASRCRSGDGVACWSDTAVSVLVIIKIDNSAGTAVVLVVVFEGCLVGRATCGCCGGLGLCFGSFGFGLAAAG